MDLEGLTRKLIDQDKNLKDELRHWLEFFKGKTDQNDLIAETIVKEVVNSLKFSSFSFDRVGLTAGESGLGSRGVGDHMVHLKLFELSKRKLDS
ncbi:MAG: AIR synthase, partial [Metallosphaera sp.]